MSNENYNDTDCRSNNVGAIDKRKFRTSFCGVCMEKEMKKVLTAILLISILTLTFALAACSNTVVTKVFPRWEDEEEYVFDISLADFDPDKKSLFKTYGDKNDYYRDMVISAAENTALLSADEILPEQLKGELTYKITKVDNSTNRKFVTVQKIYAQYKKADLENYENYADLQQMAVQDGPFNDGDTFITLYSQSTAEVIFKNEAISDIYIVPVSSNKVEDGFYVGRAYQGVSRYEIAAEYDFDSRAVKVTKTTKSADGTKQEPVTVNNKLSIAKGGYCIDSNMLLLYARSLSKSSGDFSSTPSVAVYNAYDNKVSTAAFGMTREQKVVLNNGGADFLTTLNVVGITVNNQAFMLQENLSDRISDYKTDVVNGNIKYTTVRFRVGTRAYELREYKNEWIDALSVADEKAQSITVSVTKAESIDLITNGTAHQNVAVSWAIKDGDTDIAKIEDGKLVISSLPAEKTTITLVATFISGDISDTKEVSVIIPAA